VEQQKQVTMKTVAINAQCKKPICLSKCSLHCNVSANLFGDSACKVIQNSLDHFSMPCFLSSEANSFQSLNPSKFVYFECQKKRITSPTNSFQMQIAMMHMLFATNLLCLKQET